jgi:hypothetical protein
LPSTSASTHTGFPAEPLGSRRAGALARGAPAACSTHAIVIITPSRPFIRSPSIMAGPSAFARSCTHRARDRLRQKARERRALGRADRWLVRIRALPQTSRIPSIGCHASTCAPVGYGVTTGSR